MIQNYLQRVGLNNKETSIYLALAEIGVQPASIIAKHCKLDRVTCYKTLKKLAERGFIKIYYHNGIQTFGIETFENLRIHLKEQTSQISDLLSDFPLAENLLKSLKEEKDLIPRLQIFEGETGIKNLFRDLLHELKDEDVHQIRMLTSNTFAERLGDVPLSRYVEEFFHEIQKNKIDLQIFEASGNLMPERINKLSPQKFDPKKLPAARGTTSIFLAGHAVYIACYKSSPIGLKIKQSEMSQIFHFIFDLINKNLAKN